MKKALRLFPLIFLGILSLFLITARVRFGYGLGDLLYYGIGFLAFIVYGIYFYFSRNKSGTGHIIFQLFAIGFCVYMALSMTIWRGVEYKWNGEIFAW